MGNHAALLGLSAVWEGERVVLSSRTACTSGLKGLAHYVREHSVRLPDEVLDHIKQRQNELSSLDVDREWWPRVGPSLTGEK